LEGGQWLASLFSKRKNKMELQTVLAMSDPEAGKIIGFFVIGPILALAYIIYKSRKDKS